MYPKTEYYVVVSVWEEVMLTRCKHGRYLPDTVPLLTVSLRKLGQGESSTGKSGIERLPGVELEQWLLSPSQSTGSFKWPKKLRIH